MDFDPNLILTIKAADPFSAQAIFLRHNKHRRVENDEGGDSEGESSRDSTPEPLEVVPEPTRLQLRFDNPPNSPAEGFVFGSDPDVCDVLIGSRNRGISGRHFRIHFDEEWRLILTCISRNNLSVSYDGCAGKQRRGEGFHWILFPGCKIQVHIRDSVRDVFILELPDLTGHEADREKRLQLYLSDYPEARRNAQSVNAVSNMQAPVYAEREALGSGSFGTVYKALNTSTGDTVALKTFKEGTKFANEVRIMKSISHKHIVSYIDYVDGPKPSLAMEYLPLGSLEKHEMTVDTARILFVQMLRAIDYLHESGITHRDIKPPNILIQRKGRDFHAKLSDFGFAKSSQALQSICGSDLFAAPEIWEAAMLCRDEVLYTNAVDIWSLGVVMLQLLRGIPRSGRRVEHPGAPQQPRERKVEEGLDWCERIVESSARLARTNEYDCLYTILPKMLVIKDSERQSASECLQLYLQNAPEDDFISPATTRTNTGLELRPALSRASTNITGLVSEACNKLAERGLIDHGMNASELLQATTSAKNDVSLDQILQDCQRSQPSGSRKRKRSTEPDTPRKSRCKTTPHDTSKRRSKTGLSTRSFKQREIQQCRITKGKTVHFRLHDRMICLDDLARAANRKPGWVQLKLDGIPAESKEASVHGTLVPFDVALPIARALNMKKIVCRETGMDEMRPPAAYQGNLYTYISVRGKRVCLREADGKVNAAHLVRAAGKHRTARNRTLEACGISATDIEQIPNHPTAQGGYVSYAHGRKMCEFLGLEVPEAMLDAEGPEGARDEDSDYISYESEHRSAPQEVYPNAFRRSSTLPPDSPEPEGTPHAGENDGEREQTSFPDSASASRVSYWEPSTRSHLSAVQPNYSIGSIGHPGWPSGASWSSLFGLSRVS